MSDNHNSTPRLLLWVVIVLMLPVAAFPVLLSQTPDEFKAMLWCYPFYVAVSGYLAYQCYASRREMTYILLFLLVLSHIAIWMFPGAV